MSDKRAVCLNCIDGRAQLPVISWIKENHGFDYVDMITEPGMDGLLADEKLAIESIIKKVRLSIDKNNASEVFIVGHYDCKGNPVDETAHKQCVQKAVKRLSGILSNVGLVGLWLDHSWVVEKL